MVIDPAFLLIEAHFQGLLMFDTSFHLSVDPLRLPNCLFCLVVPKCMSIGAFTEEEHPPDFLKNGSNWNIFLTEVMSDEGSTFSECVKECLYDLQMWCGTF